MKNKTIIPPSSIKVNKSALDYAKNLIKQGKVNCMESVGEYTPIIIDEENYLKHHTMHEYGNWFLAINDSANESDKERYEFPIGDFNHIYRDALLNVKKHAKRYNYELVEYAVDELLSLIDQVCQCMTDFKKC